MHLTETVSRGGVASKRWHPSMNGTVGLLLALPAILLLSFFVAYPLVQLLTDSTEGYTTFAHYGAVLMNEVSQLALLSTLSTSVIVALTTTAIGAILAWTLYNTERRWLRTVLWITVLIPFTMGTIIKNYAILLLLVANGPVNALITGLGLSDEPVSLLYTPAAVVYGITYSLIPYSTLTLFAVFSQLDKSLLSAAAVLGASRFKTLRTVVLPQIRGGVGITLSLIFALSVGFYVTPVLLGGIQNPFVATLINQQIFLLYDYAGASATAVVVLLIALVVMGITIAFAGRGALRGVLR